MRRIVTILPTLLLPVMFGLLAVAGSVDARTIGTLSDTSAGVIEQDAYAAIAAAKPHNVWTTAALRDAGYAGCVKVQTADQIDYANPPTGHVVRLPVAEGFGFTVMPSAEVADRVAAFGGTPTTTDDVKIVGNCY